MRDIVLIAHNLRSAHNVGSLLRTAEGLGVSKIYLTGYTPFPKTTRDKRLPHMASKIDKQISKTALGAEKSIPWMHAEDVHKIVQTLKQEDYLVVGLEQTEDSVKLPEFSPPQKLAIIVGREVEGIEKALIELCDKIVEVPMFGTKESFNVVQAAAMALYHVRFFPFMQ